MKQLKRFLFAIYPVLILLLLLFNIRKCNPGTSENPEMPTSNEVEDDPSIIRQAESIGDSGELKVTLLWDFQGDIDLHVCQPNGRTINYEKHRDMFTGGYLDVDNRNGGNGAAENIYWKQAKKGTYKVFIEYYGPSKATGITEFGQCAVVVFQPEIGPTTYKVNMDTVKDRKFITEITIAE